MPIDAAPGRMVAMRCGALPVAVLLVLSGAGGCQKEAGLVLSLVADLQSPEELSEVSVSVSGDGLIGFSNADTPWRLGPGQPDRLPGSIAFYTDLPGPELTITVTGSRQ